MAAATELLDYDLHVESSGRPRGYTNGISNLAQRERRDNVVDFKQLICDFRTRYTVSGRSGRIVYGDGDGFFIYRDVRLVFRLAHEIVSADVKQRLSFDGIRAFSAQIQNRAECPHACGARELHGIEEYAGEYYFGFLFVQDSCWNRLFKHVGDQFARRGRGRLDVLDNRRVFEFRGLAVMIDVHDGMGVIRDVDGFELVFIIHVNDDEQGFGCY